MIENKAIHRISDVDYKQFSCCVKFPFVKQWSDTSNYGENVFGVDLMTLQIKKWLIKFVIRSFQNKEENDSNISLLNKLLSLLYFSSIQLL